MLLLLELPLILVCLSFLPTRRCLIFAFSLCFLLIGDQAQSPNFRLPDAFWCRFESVKIKANSSSKIPLQFLPFLLGGKHPVCFLVSFLTLLILRFRYYLLKTFPPFSLPSA